MPELCSSFHRFIFLYSSAHNLSPLPEDSHIQKTGQQLTGCLATTVILKIWGQKGVVQLQATDGERLGQVIAPALCGSQDFCCSGVWCVAGLQVSLRRMARRNGPSFYDGIVACFPTFLAHFLVIPLRDRPMVWKACGSAETQQRACHVHAKYWERKIRRDTHRCWTVNGGCRMANAKCFLCSFTIVNEQKAE